MLTTRYKRGLDASSSFTKITLSSFTSSFIQPSVINPSFALQSRFSIHSSSLSSLSSFINVPINTRLEKYALKTQDTPLNDIIITCSRHKSQVYVPFSSFSSSSPVLTNPSPSSNVAPTSSTSSSSPSSSTFRTPAPKLLRVPELQLGDAKLLRWRKNVGDKIEVNDVLCDIDSDLAVIDYRVQEKGILAVRAVPEGAPLIVDQILAAVVSDLSGIPSAQEYVENEKLKEEKEGSKVQHTVTEDIAGM